VVVLKSGRTRAGGRAAGSHTAALAASDTATDALFRQTGIIRAETLEEMFDLARALSDQPLPAGRRVGIVTNAGGPAILCTDACESNGLTVPELSAPLRAELARQIPSAASLANPLDLIAAAGAEQMALATRALMVSGEVDAIIVIYTPVGLFEPKQVWTAVGEAVKQAGRPLPVFACRVGETATSAGLPTYAFPEAPARALARAAAYAEWRSQPLGVTPDFDDIDVTAARAVCRKGVADHGAGWLGADDATVVLGGFRLPVPAAGLARSAEEAAELAARAGFPVVVKLASRELVHKTEAGGVRLNLADDLAVRAAFADIRARLERDGKLAAMDGVVVQPMLTGVEVMVGVTLDPLFGPLVAFGLGGVYVELLGDVCFRVAPLTDRDAAEMVRSIRGVRLLQGYRGHPPADLSALEELLLRVSRLAEELPEIDELDLNPVFAGPPGAGCRIADARIHVRANASGVTPTVVGRTVV
jgi:acyl-CoA synthetase (NDP forming)